MTEKPRYFCCVCGKEFPENATRYKLLQNGNLIQKPDGSVVFSCNNHSKEQIENALFGVPRFKKGSET